MPRSETENERRQTIRQQITELITGKPFSALEISLTVKIREKEVFDHLAHIEKSVRAQNQRLVVTPAQCLACGYAFTDRKRISKPGRCPKCKDEHLADPLYEIR